MLRRVLLLIFIGIMGIAVTVGCGGCGGSNGSSLMPNSDIQNNGTRQIQPGDSLSYSVTGLARENYNVSGTATVKTYTEDRTPVYGTRALKQVTEFNVIVDGRPLMLTCVDHIEQDTNGNIYCVEYQRGDAIETLVDVSSEPLKYPGTCSNHMYWTYTAEMRGTEFYRADCLASITDQKSVDGYQAYVLSTNEFLGDVVMRQESNWFVPELGHPVKSTLDITQDSSWYLLTMTLTEKNF
jgi:hypothetical protein